MTFCVYADPAAGIDSQAHGKRYKERQLLKRADRLLLRTGESGQQVNESGLVSVASLLTAMDWDDSEKDPPWAWDAGGHVRAVRTSLDAPRSASVAIPVVPTDGRARAKADLNVRDEPSVRDGRIVAVVPKGGKMKLTGQLRGPWRSVEVKLSGDLSPATIPVKGWVHGDYLAVRTVELSGGGVFPTFTHLRTWHLASVVPSMDRNRVGETMDDLAKDIKGWQRAGVRMEHVQTPGEADVLVKVVEEACGGAPACWWGYAQPIIEISAQYWASEKSIRPFYHEWGHDLGHFYDHYKNAPKYPRAIRSVMGDWVDAEGGTHFTPDVDDIAALRSSLTGSYDLVFREAGE